MSLPDKLINLSSLKRRRTTRSGAVKGHGMSSSISQPSSKSMNPEPSPEPSATSTVHDRHVITNPKLKHAEEKLASSDTKTLNPETALSYTRGRPLLLNTQPTVKKLNSNQFICGCCLPTKTF
ncbi:unnamed protein product [Lactuca virosa]|uniref:Uncharacterized protein n=1 Tax=Lactuca virosa TaxID=75947 RepID=A0AAU9P2V8_9ASTR|nr:unnamed protein product [Lactuca virosa]